MRTFFIAIALLGGLTVYAQDDLLSELEKEQDDRTDYVIQTFKGTRVINGHSVETKPRGALEFIIMHRFGPLNSGSYELWGLDFATIRIGLEYGISDRFGIGIGRSALDKTFDGYLKYKAVRQASGTNGFPFTITMLGSMAYKNEKSPETAGFSSSDRTAYNAQLLIARKFSPSVSFQVAPILVHRNRVNESIETNDLLALGIGGRVKLTKSVAINLEYYPRLNENSANPAFDALGVGIDIETGGHVFQLIFTNSYGMMERRLVAENGDDFFDGGIHFGFNITRTFQLKKE